MFILKAAKGLAKKELSKSANSTSSFHAYQPKAPKELKKFKK